MSVGQQPTDTLVCFCYEVTEQQLRTTIDSVGLQSVEEIALHTGAGTGCTACHCRLRKLLAGLPIKCPLAEICEACGFHVSDCACRVA